jgi:hypothetical protein
MSGDGTASPFLAGKPLKTVSAQKEEQKEKNCRRPAAAPSLPAPSTIAPRWRGYRILFPRRDGRFQSSL